MIEGLFSAQIYERLSETGVLIRTENLGLTILRVVSGIDVVRMTSNHIAAAGRSPEEIAGVVVDRNDRLPVLGRERLPGRVGMRGWQVGERNRRIDVRGEKTVCASCAWTRDGSI